LIAASLKPSEILDLDADQLIRGVRDRRKVSQRELAQRAGLPLSTISRIESGAVSPRFDTLRRLLKAAHVAIVVVDTQRPFDPIADDPLLDPLRDRAGRHPPAHLPRWLILNMFDPWWGWGRTAWFMSDKKVPTHSYEGRPRNTLARWDAWLDAT